MIPGIKSKYGLMGGDKIFCNVLQERIPSDEILVELEIQIIEAFKITENMKETN